MISPGQVSLGVLLWGSCRPTWRPRVCEQSDGCSKCRVKTLVVTAEAVSVRQDWRPNRCRASRDPCLLVRGDLLVPNTYNSESIRDGF